MSNHFVHPLSAVSQVRVAGKVFETVNSWGSASFVINAILHPASTSDNGDKAKLLFATLVLDGNPLVDVSELLSLVQSGDKPAIMLACNFIANGLEAKVEAAFNV
jgi:hypothetical protein